MSSHSDPSHAPGSQHGHGHADGGHHAPTSFWTKYIFSTDHKVIGIQFMIVSLLFVILGGLLALGVRYQLAWPFQNVPYAKILPGRDDSTSGVKMTARSSEANVGHWSVGQTVEQKNAFLISPSPVQFHPTGAKSVTAEASSDVPKPKVQKVNAVVQAKLKSFPKGLAVTVPKNTLIQLADGTIKTAGEVGQNPQFEREKDDAKNKVLFAWVDKKFVLGDYNYNKTQVRVSTNTSVTLPGADEKSSQQVKLVGVRVYQPPQEPGEAPSVYHDQPGPILLSMRVPPILVLTPVTIDVPAGLAEAESATIPVKGLKFETTTREVALNVEGDIDWDREIEYPGVVWVEGVALPAKVKATLAAPLAQKPESRYDAKPVTLVVKPQEVTVEKMPFPINPDQAIDPLYLPREMPQPENMSDADWAAKPLKEHQFFPTPESVTVEKDADGKVHHWVMLNGKEVNLGDMPVLLDPAKVLWSNQLNDKQVTYNVHFLDSQGYLALFTMHASIMIFFVIIPMLVGGFGNFVVPLMVGARDMAFPRINMLSFWLAAPAGILMIASFWVPGGPAGGGWTMYPTLSEHSLANGQTLSPGLGSTFWVIGVALVGFSSIVGALNYITTIINMRAPGMTLFRMPLTVWSILITATLALFATPVLTGAMIMLTIDRLLDAHFFLPQGGGQPIMWQHLFWFYSHPAVYIMILPAMGVTSDILATFARKPIFGYKPMAFAMAGIAFLGFIVWGHHMFQSGMNPVLGTTFMASTIMIAVPSAIKVFNWLGTLWGGNIRFTPAMLNALAFVSMFVIGGLSGIFMASSPVDIHIHDTYFIVAHIHYVLFGGSLFGIFAGIYYWYPKMFGRQLNQRWGVIHFIMTFIGFNGTFFIMHSLGAAGHPRRYASLIVYEGLHHLQPLNVIMTIFAMMLGLGQIPFLYNFFASLPGKAGRNILAFFLVMLGLSVVIGKMFWGSFTNDHTAFSELTYKVWGQVAGNFTGTQTFFGYALLIGALGLLITLMIRGMNAEHRQANLITLGLLLIGGAMVAGIAAFYPANTLFSRLICPDVSHPTDSTAMTVFTAAVLLVMFAIAIGAMARDYLWYPVLPLLGILGFVFIVLRLDMVDWTRMRPEALGTGQWDWHALMRDWHNICISTGLSMVYVAMVVAVLWSLWWVGGKVRLEQLLQRSLYVIFLPAFLAPAILKKDLYLFFGVTQLFEYRWLLMALTAVPGSLYLIVFRPRDVFGAIAGDNPWHANSLEWCTTSPPPHTNFDAIPTVYRGPYEFSSPVVREDYLPQPKQLPPGVVEPAAH